MAHTIEELTNNFLAKMSQLKSSMVIGDTTELSQDQQNEVSAGMDEVNQTWNTDLPPRP